MVEEKSKRLASAIGLCRKAGKIALGTEMVCDGVRAHRVLLVVASGLASDNTKKKISDCCAFYNTEVRFCEISPEELGAAIGKGTVSCIGITDENFKRLIENNL